MKKYLFYISENYSFKILRPIQAVIKQRGDVVKWFIEGSNVNRGYFKDDEIELNSVSEINKFKPDAVLLPGNLAPNFISGLKVSLFHGFIGGKQRQKDSENYFFIIRNCFDLYCTHGPSSTAPFEKLAQKHQYFNVAETGFCQMDPYYYKDKPKKTKNNRPIILFSSTFSPRITQAPALLKVIEKLSKNTKWQWQVTFHPKMDPSTVEAYKAIQHDNLTFIETDNLIPTMEQADLMLADYSSMITDFILLNKPVVTFRNPDGLEHLVNVDNESELELAIENALARPKSLMNKIEQFAHQTHPYTDGKSSERVLDAIDQCINSKRSKKKPLNLLRNFKLRKKLGYWKF